MSDSPRGIDVRGPRFGATITSVLLAITVVLAVSGIATAQSTSASGTQPSGGASFFGSSWVLPSASFVERVSDPGFIALALVAALFLWGVLSPRTAPWGVLFRRVVAPRLSPARDFEDPRPPRFAQGVGLAVTVIGLLLHLAGVPLALPIAAGAAFSAAFLNAAFGLCLGCMMYLALQRLRPANAL